MGRLATDYAYIAGRANSKFLPEDINRIGCAHANLARFDVYDSEAQPATLQGDEGSQPDVKAPEMPRPTNQFVFGTKAPSNQVGLVKYEPPPDLSKMTPHHMNAAALPQAGQPVTPAAPPSTAAAAPGAVAPPATQAAGACVPAALAVIPPPRLPVLNKKKCESDDDKDVADDEDSGPVQADSGGTPEDTSQGQHKIDAAELRRKEEVLLIFF